MQTDIAIIGAGFSGATLAHSLSHNKYSVCLIDKRKSCPDIFRAEKIEAEQAAVMRELGTFHLRSPCLPPIGKLNILRDGIVSDYDEDEQYGISYSETVNNMNSQLSSNIQRIYKKVNKISNGNVSQTIYFSDGTKIKSRLIVFATGGSEKLLSPLNIKRRYEKILTSLSFGFYIEPVDSDNFDFNGFNCFLENNENKINYITIFPIGDRMRVNLFTQLNLKSEITKELRNDTILALDTHFPDLKKYIGEIKLTSKVQVMPTLYYRLYDHIKPGVVIIGDEFQSVNPATGSGLSKVLSDVNILSNKYIPIWLESSASKKNISKYYKDTNKTKVDSNSLSSWIYYYHNLTPRISIHEKIRHKLKLMGWY